MNDKNIFLNEKQQRVIQCESLTELGKYENIMNRYNNYMKFIEDMNYCSPYMMKVAEDLLETATDHICESIKDGSLATGELCNVSVSYRPYNTTEIAAA